MNSLQDIKQHIKTSPQPWAQFTFRQLKALRHMALPAPRWLFCPLYSVHCGLRDSLTSLTRFFWWTPLFKGRLNRTGNQLYLYGGLPFVSGSLQISIGDNCRISGHTTFSGRTCSRQQPRLLVGNNVDIGWMSTIAVGQRIKIGNNVRIAGRALLAGYPGHPLNAKDRAAGLPELDSQVGDIVLEDDVWLATGVTVTAGVHIGCGTIVAAGSVVTKNLPAGVLAGGVPAKVLAKIPAADKANGELSGATRRQSTTCNLTHNAAR
ncbi:acetyltransferase [Gammaproteobacteria bacterium 53_120_T64]|nr:acetyltransferase [Gammaproteobacteria bacterium 53_120_T64]